VQWTSGDEGGRIAAYSEATEQHLVNYDDGDSQWHDLLMEENVGTLAFVDPPRRMCITHDDSVPHYITYNASTRVLNMYPNVLVLEESDVVDVAGFVEWLSGAPHYLYVPPESSRVRQVFVKVHEPRCLEVPHVCSTALRKHASRTK